MNYRLGVKLNGAFQDLGHLWKDLIVSVGYGMNSAVVSTGRVKREGRVRYGRNSAGVVSIEANLYSQMKFGQLFNE